MVHSISQVRSLYDEKRLEVIVDKDLKGCFNAEELEKSVDVALKCTQPNPNQRPKMSEVSRILEGIAGQMAPVVDDSQGGSNASETRAFSFSRNFSSVEESSFIIEAIELSGPR